MAGRAYEALRRVNRAEHAEDSIRLRLTVLATVEMSVVALWASGAVPALDALATLALVPVGAWLSYCRRRRDNTAVKLLLTLGAALALWRFFNDLGIAGTIDDTREPLAQLFLAVQVLHGFDLPDRRSLGFSMASTLALVALGGVASTQPVYGVLLVVYVLLAGLALAGLQQSVVREQAADAAAGAAAALREAPTGPARARSRPQVAASVAAGGAATLRAAGPLLLVALCVFLVLPRPESARLAGLSFSGLPSLRLAISSVYNPGLDGAGQLGPGDEPLGFNPNAYFGFAEHVDLRTVGALSDEVVLRVRADRPRLWRGMVFDTYDASAWSRSHSDPAQAEDFSGLPVLLPSAPRPGEAPETVVQTYEVVQDTPNLVFGAATPIAVYLAARTVTLWPDDTLTTYGPQDAGTVYTVVSRIPTASPGELRLADGPVPETAMAAYLQLPEGLPSRVHRLAHEVTVGAGTTYAKAEAVQAWLGANTEYTLDAPAPPRRADAVDHFLFGSRQGWCEPIASSMVVLLRAAGVPARFVTGFVPGDRNPLTGWYTVRMHHAHAWVEVWVPGHGWSSFDPTGAVPPAALGTQRPPRIPLLEVAAWVRERLPAPGPVPAGLLAGLAVAAASGAAALGLRARRRRPPPADAFQRLAALLAADGVPRHPWQTPREFVLAVRRHRPSLAPGALEELLAWEEARRYAPDTDAGPEPQGALADVRAALARR